MQFKTVDEVIRAHAQDRPETLALRLGERTWTYRQLHDESARVAQAILAEGVEPQERVAFLGRNEAEYIPFLFGATMANAVILPVNWRLAPAEMQFILDHAETRVLLIGEEFLGHLDQMNLATVKRVVVIGQEGIHACYAEWIAGHPAIDPRRPRTPDDTFCQFYTSGTTGRPKGVELSHSSLLAATEIAARDWLIDERSVTMIAMPIYHIAGSGLSIAGLAAGGEILLVRDLDPALALRLIEERRVTNALFVPAVLRVLMATPGVENTDFSSLRAIVYGASPISEEVLVRSMKTFRCGFIQVYGLTETSGAITAMPPADHDPGGPRAHLLRAAGKPWGDVEIRIVDADSTRDLPDGEVGEVWCRTRQNLRGYWRNPEATAAAYPEGRDANGLGWFRTGDAGCMKDGYLYIHDRVKDMIVSGGENIYPAEVENVLMAHPGVSDVAVIGVPSEQWGETVKAIVVDELGHAASEADLIAWCRERLAHFKCPTSIDRISVIPRNPSGKVLKTQLREPFWKGQTRQVH